MRITILAGRLSKERNPIPYQLAEGLSSLGFTVELITGYPSRGLSKEQVQYYRSCSDQVINDNFIIRRVGSHHEETRFLIIRALDYVIVSFSVYKAATKSKSDTYIIYSSPPFLMLATKRLTRYARVIINVQDLFPDSLLSILKNPIRKLFKWPLKFIMGRVYRSADKIVTISEDMKDTIVSYGVSQKVISVASNWANNTSGLDYVLPVENPLYKEYKLDYDTQYIVYAGNIGRFQAVEKVLDLAEVSKTIGNEFRFLIFGDGDRKDLIESIIIEKNLDNVRVLPLQPPDKVKFVYSIGTFNVLSLSPNVVSYAHPSKTAYLLATGVPILAIIEESSNLANFIIENHLGCVFSNGDRDPSRIKMELDGLKDYLKRLKNIPLKNARKLMEKKYSFKNALTVYAAAIYEAEEVMSKGKGELSD